MIELIGPEVKSAYLDAVEAESMSSGFGCAAGLGVDGCNSRLNVVYTPLNGAGNKCVRKILARIGIAQVTVVPEQEKPDGHFPTCPYPNPEKREALAKGLELCAKLASEARSLEEVPDILLATDPDSDRVGIAVKHPAVTEQAFSDAHAGGVALTGEYLLLSGNEVGVLLLDFICSMRSGKGGVKPLPENPITIKTIVTTKMVDDVAASYGVSVIDVLTGFKFIGEQIGILEKKGEEARYIFGFEESYGYLAGAYVRDKDAVNGAMLICEMAAYYKNQGKTLVDAMNDLYDKHGHYRNSLMDFGFEGASGMDKMAAIMDRFRKNPPKQAAGKAISRIADYLVSEKTELAGEAGLKKKSSINLPKSDVLEYGLEDGSSFIIRPSGTEPKIKVYLSAKGMTASASQDMVDRLAAEISAQIV
jgi:phosphoglucomutase